MNTIIHFSALIPAAGKSGRMTTSKLFLPFGEHTFAVEIAEKYVSAGAAAVVFVVNRDDFEILKGVCTRFPKQVQFVINDNPQLGRFRSIRLGLAALPPDMPCFLQNIDNPFVRSDVLCSMLSISSPEITVIPSCENKLGHPVLIGTEIQNKLLNDSGDDCILKSELSRYTTNIVEVNNPEILYNINTPEDYKMVFGKPLP
ncbi:Molybdenum cofactor guanylyltransferase [bioreactor metagenome]|uniref:Molybdenum cofactor guanylyltransferase n=1 Tax=bioreactor metagenome TaxID=1076179 RepID=A0A644WSC1_9ZZZZ